MGEDIKITYETIFELLRNEKNKPELQKLDETYYSDIVNYLTEKMQITLTSQDELFAENEKLKVEKQLTNIKRMLRDLYDKRESKIINMALNRARTGSNIIDTSALLKEETEMYEKLCEVFSGYRKDILLNLINAKLPELVKAVPEVAETRSEAAEGEKCDCNKMVRFTCAVPKFVGKDLEVYGPFEEEDMANLPGEIADILILKQRAEEITEG